MDTSGSRKLTCSIRVVFSIVGTKPIPLLSTLIGTRYSQGVNGSLSRTHLVNYNFKLDRDCNVVAFFNLWLERSSVASEQFTSTNFRKHTGTLIDHGCL